MSDLVKNERLKLAASAANTLGVAMVITGVIAPTATAIYGGAIRSGFSAEWLLIFAV